jgi:hypothetical protein
MSIPDDLQEISPFRVHQGVQSKVVQYQKMLLDQFGIGSSLGSQRPWGRQDFGTEVAETSTISLLGSCLTGLAGFKGKLKE